MGAEVMRSQIFRKWIVAYLAVALCLLCSPIAHAQDADLAKKLSNPIANLISIPFQFNYNDKIGPLQDGKQSYLNIQPVIPFHLNPNWNLISRTILPIVSQTDIFPGSGHQFGLGDTLQSLFFSPVSPGPGGIIWGVGPALQFPTATDMKLGTGKYSAGPTGVVLWQTGGFTYGMLANHLWSYAGDSNRKEVSSTFLQPFVSYTTKDAWTFSLNTESTYNWVTDKWSVPINGTIAKLVRFGKLPVQIGGGLRYWAASPDNAGPKDLGYRFFVTVLLPSK
jgi:hypothetical protein